MPAKKQKNKKKQHSTQPAGINEHENGSTTAKASPFKVDISEIYGRYLVASRNISPGELIMTEEPLAIGPCVSADAVCLGCYKPVELSVKQYRCSACNWPLCGSQCRGINQTVGHTAYECSFLATCKAKAGDLLTSTSTPIQVKNHYELILVVRILLLKKHDPEKYTKILEMQSHTEERKANSELWKHYEENVVKRLIFEWNLSDCDATEIHTICGIIDVNCFEIGQNGCKARTLYPSAFFLAHDCTPNTSHTDDPQTYAIILRTSRSVRKNEPLTLSYAYTLQGTLKRRDFMHAGKLFWCCCKRCSDPTELGTDCSAIVCTKCRNGFLRSTDPLNQDANWKCDCCNFVLTASEVIKLLDKVNNDLELIDAHNVVGLENFLSTYSNVFHPNHYFMLSAKYSLCQIYGRIGGYLLTQMSIEQIKRKEKYCRDFLEVIDVLEPGLTRLRGLIMYELHAPVLVLAQYKMQNNLINRRDFNNAIKEVKKLLLQSRDILLMEPEGSNENQMGLAAANALSQME